MRQFALTSLLILACAVSAFSSTLRVVCPAEADLYKLIEAEGIPAAQYASADAAIAAADRGDGLLISAPGYPAQGVAISPDMLKAAKAKKLRMLAEYVCEYPGIAIADTAHVAALERGVISSKFFAPQLRDMDLLGLNGAHIFRADVAKPLISFAKVAGYDRAQYGLTDTDVFPLLYKDGDNMLAFTAITNYQQARYAPVASWKAVWTRLLQWLTGDKKLALKHFEADVRPMYGRTDALAADARRTAVERGADWLYKGKFLIHPSWADSVRLWQGDGLQPYGPGVAQTNLIGNGSAGVLEGHCSAIDHLGQERYRYWLRADVQGEAAFMLAAAGQLLDKKEYAEVSENLLDYLFYTSNFREGEKKKAGSPAEGLIGWAETHPYVFYNDDNARCVLGAIGASALIGEKRWNKIIEDCIMANLRLASRQGFIPERIEEPDLLSNGLAYYSDRDFIFPHPHFDSWMWACYLWLYDKTGNRELLDKAESAIRLTMEAYPDNWRWTNGIQQERARMVLPLAWLVRVDDTPEHREWLDTVVQRLLSNQQPSGAIREELGASGLGMFGNTQSNKDYGVTEAPLISRNGDPVADMLYTCNFAFFALNEAAHATGNPQYKEAVDKLSDFLVRIQVRSDRHPDMDGAWLRAFDYDRWDYWASNADSGWGAWCTLTGWIQSWITATNALVEQDNSYWELTKSLWQ